MKESLFTQNKNPDEENRCKTVGIYTLLVLWTIVSIVLGVVGVLVVIASYISRCACCIINCFYYCFCSQRTHKYKDGEDEVEVRIGYGEEIRRNTERAKDQDKELAKFGECGAFCVLEIIPWGYNAIKALR